MTAKLHRWLLGSCWGRPEGLGEEHFWVRTGGVWSPLCQGHSVEAVEAMDWFEGTPYIHLSFDPAGPRCEACADVYLATDQGRRLGIRAPTTD